VDTSPCVELQKNKNKKSFKKKLLALFEYMILKDFLGYFYRGKMLLNNKLCILILTRVRFKI